MRIRLQVCKGGLPIYEGIHDVSDAGSFGHACATAWAKLSEQRLAKPTSVGALFEALDDEALDDLNGVELRLSPA